MGAHAWKVCGKWKQVEIHITYEMSGDELTELFRGIGLSESKAKDTVKNANLSKNLEEAIRSTQNAKISQAQGMLLYHVASKMKPQIKHHIGFLAKYVADGKLDNELRVNAALEFLISNASNKDIVTADLDKACGVGIVVTPEEIESAVEKVLKANKAALEAQRYRFPIFQLMAGVRKSLPWA